MYLQQITQAIKMSVIIHPLISQHSFTLWVKKDGMILERYI